MNTPAPNLFPHSMVTCTWEVTATIIKKSLSAFSQYSFHRLAVEIANFKPDIIQLNGGRSVKYGTLAKKLYSGKFTGALVYRVIDIPSFWNKGITRQLYRRLLVPEIDGIVAVSTLSLKDARMLYDIQVPAEVILNGVDFSKLRPLRTRAEIRGEYGLKESHIVLLFLNSLVEQKRPDRFIEAFSKVRAKIPEARAWIVGDGKLRRKCEEMTRNLGLDGDCLFLGYQRDVASFIEGADIVVLTSDTEGLPAVILEAGYLGRPVVTTNVGGVQECVVDGVTGVLVAQGDLEGMAVAISRLASDVKARETIGSSARERTEEVFAIDKVATSYLAFYRRMSE